MTLDLAEEIRTELEGPMHESHESHETEIA